MRSSYSRAGAFLCAVAVVTVGTAALVQSGRPDPAELSRVVESLGIHPGSVVADVGAGSGDWTLELARQVEETGRVYANEVDPDDLRRIRNRVSDEGLENVTVISGSQRSTGLPAGCCDAILLRRVYHHFTDPASMNASLWQSLRPGGRLLVIDFETRRRWNRPEGIPSSRDGHGVDKEQVLEEVLSSGFSLVRELPWERGDYALLFRTEPQSSSAIPDESSRDPSGR